MKVLVKEMSFKSGVKGGKTEGVIDGENEDDDCDEVICAG